MLTGTCYEHEPVIGASAERMSDFEQQLLDTCQEHSFQVFAWCVLPNHYHILLSTDRVRAVLKKAARLHGRTSFDWNGQDATRGRRVWFDCAETLMKSERHFHATLNYIHHNSVRHGFAASWQEWPWSSAADYLARVGREEAVAHWRNYPIERYGQSWDCPDQPDPPPNDHT